MSERQPKRDEVEQLASKWAAGWEGRTYLALVLLPGVIGALLVIDGLTNAGYVEAVIGLLLVGCTPFVARWVSRSVDL